MTTGKKLSILWPLLLATLLLSSCQPSGSTPNGTATPVESPTLVSKEWKVEYEIVRDPGKSYTSGSSLVAHSDGACESSSWQNGVVPPEPETRTGTLSPEDKSRLIEALGHPGLSQAPPPPPPPGPPSDELRAGVHTLRVTANGKSAEAVSNDGRFPTGWQELKETVESVVPVAVEAANKGSTQP